MTILAIAGDEDSVAANRAARLTAEQQRRIAAAVRAEATPNLIGMGLFLLLVTLLLLASLSGSSDMPPSGFRLFGALFVVIVLIMGVLVWRRARLLQDVHAGHLERATGHVVWKAGAYRVDVPGGTLNLTAFNLGSGTYDFSFLPRSRRVVAVELAAADTPEQVRDELLHALSVAHHFNVDDLPAFRQGRLGQAGPRRLRRIWSTAGWLLLGALLCLVLFVIIVNMDGSKDLAPMPFMFAIFLGLGVLGSAVGDLNPTLDVLGGRVVSAQGQVQRYLRQTHGRGATTFYYYRLNDQTWSVSAEAYRALLTGRGYRVFYLPGSKQLVGIEPTTTD